MKFNIETERDDDGRRIADVIDLPGVLAYGATRAEASSKARRALAALLRIGWSVKREGKGSHRVLSRSGLADFVFAFHDGEEIGPRMLS